MRSKAIGILQEREKEAIGIDIEVKSNCSELNFIKYLLLEQEKYPFRIIVIT